MKTSLLLSVAFAFVLAAVLSGAVFTPLLFGGWMFAGIYFVLFLPPAILVGAVVGALYRWGQSLKGRHNFYAGTGH